MSAATSRRAAVYASLAVAWVVAAWLLAKSVVPRDLELPPVDVDAVFGSGFVARAERYERFLYVNWALSQVAVLGTLAVYARRGARLARESAAGPIGTGMLLGMLGIALAWLAGLPFSVLALWWDRRHGLSRVAYVDVVLGGWLALAGTFLALTLALVVVMALARWLGSWWWLPAALALGSIAAVLVFAEPYLATGLEPPSDQRLEQSYERLARAEGVDGVTLRVEKVSGDTTQANAYAFGLGPSRRIVVWDTLLDGRFADREVDVVLAHELGHQASHHIAKAIGWFVLFALPAALVVMLVTRRRRRDGRPGVRAARTPGRRAPCTRRDAGPERRESSHGERGRLEGARDDARPDRRARALPRARGDLARRPQPADVGVRRVRDAPDPRPARRDGRCMGRAREPLGAR